MSLTTQFKATEVPGTPLHPFEGFTFGPEDKVIDLDQFALPSSPEIEPEVKTLPDEPLPAPPSFLHRDDNSESESDGESDPKRLELFTDFFRPLMDIRVLNLAAFLEFVPKSAELTSAAGRRSVALKIVTELIPITDIVALDKHTPIPESSAYTTGMLRQQDWLLLPGLPIREWPTEPETFLARLDRMPEFDWLSPYHLQAAMLATAGLAMRNTYGATVRDPVDSQTSCLVDALLKFYLQAINVPVTISILLPFALGCMREHDAAACFVAGGDVTAVDSDDTSFSGNKHRFAQLADSYVQARFARIQYGHRLLRNFKHTDALSYTCFAGILSLIFLNPRLLTDLLESSPTPWELFDNIDGASLNVILRC